MSVSFDERFIGLFFQSPPPLNVPIDDYEILIAMDYASRIEQRNFVLRDLRKG
jgi:hypothetical protein